MTLPKLPPLPPLLLAYSSTDLIPGDQVEAYGLACWNSAIEYAAGRCEASGKNYDNEWNRKLGVAEPAVEICSDCAAEIRKGKR